MKTVLHTLISSVFSRLLLTLLLAAGTASTAFAQTVTYFHNDVAGTPQMATNVSGAVLWRENYLPYGYRQVAEPASTSNKLWFTGKPYDPDTQLSYMGARYYMPLLGRFTGVDPVEVVPEQPHSFNRYAYANNNPNRYTDRNGMWAEDVLLALPGIYMGSQSLVANVQRGNWMGSVVDTGGLVADGFALALPGVPGGAGLAIKSIRETREAATRGISGNLPDSTIVCRGGSCTADSFRNGTGVTSDATEKLSGISTGIGDSVTAASKNIPHPKVGVSTVGDIRKAGGQVVNDKGNHADVSGITAQQASELFKNVVKNPNRKSP